ncbi:hypothetical protein OH76DRAFT_1400918 [Lentinus brumalis]|uniref:Uncharacterized protein n=1 Tax=Lentinus brumalis TaxID=2498619 RepID=A0A371DHK2_9APHY|nr:hypothetical protein OH76DRAFT_1400918 [Polyporus brumalis]
MKTSRQRLHRSPSPLRGRHPHAVPRGPPCGRSPLAQPPPPPFTIASVSIHLSSRDPFMPHSGPELSSILSTTS